MNKTKYLGEISLGYQMSKSNIRVDLKSKINADLVAKWCLVILLVQFFTLNFILVQIALQLGYDFSSIVDGAYIWMIEPLKIDLILSNGINF